VRSGRIPAESQVVQTGIPRSARVVLVERNRDMRELNSTSRQATALPPYATHPRAADAVIRIEHVTKVFRGRNHDTVTALEGVSLSVP
jgi:hypothetical protein